MSNNAQRYGGHGDRSIKGTGKRKDRNTNNRDNKVNGVGGSEPKHKWDPDQEKRKRISRELFALGLKKYSAYRWVTIFRRRPRADVSPCRF